MEYVWLRDFQSSFSPQDLEAVNRLLVRLSPNSPALSMQDLERISTIVGMHIILAIDPTADGLLVGMARLNELPMLVGSEGLVNDVVVSQQYGGRGIGTELMRRLITQAKELGLRRIALVCWPQSKGANRLYASLGFEKLGVNYYRLKM